MKKSRNQLCSPKSTNLLSSQVIENFLELYDPDGIFEEKIKKIVKPRRHAHGKQISIQQELELFEDESNSINS